MTDTTDPSFPTPELASAIDAVRQMGTNALPFLVGDIRAREALIWKKMPVSVYRRFRFISRARNAYYRDDQGPHERHDQAVFFLRAMGPLAKPAIPALAECLDQPETAEPAVDVLGFYDSHGPAGLGLDATSALLKAITNANFMVRRKAANALDLLRVDADLAIPALLRALRDPYAEVRATAARGLGYKAKAAVVVPALIGVLDDSDRYVRSGALWRLGMHGSNAAPAVPKILGCLRDADVRVRTEATNAIRLIDPEAAKAAGVN
jgi:HEAT repeat protein